MRLARGTQVQIKTTTMGSGTQSMVVLQGLGCEYDPQEVEGGSLDAGVGALAVSCDVERVD
jgi:hypothetical protein